LSTFTIPQSSGFNRSSEPSDGSKSVYLTMVFTDLVDSTRIKSSLGDAEAVRIISQHHQIVRELLDGYEGAFEIDQTGDGFFLAFPTPSEAVTFALSLQQIHAQLIEEMPPVRVGIHAGEVVKRPAPSGSSKKWELIGLAVDQAARISGLALGRQILLTQVVLDNARQRLKGSELDSNFNISWMAHGDYRLKGIDGSMSIGEVGIEGYSTLAPPPNSEKATRDVLEADEITLGWRPGVGMDVPHADRFVLKEKLGEGGFGEVWLGEHRATHTRRVFKFCFHADRLRSLKRELMMLRLLSEALGERPDIAKVHDVQFDEPPFYLIMEYTEGGNLIEWVESKGGVEEIPLKQRLKIVSQIGKALAAAHSIGVVHKDVKPTNILIEERQDGTIQPRLTDFGIGELVDEDFLKEIQLSGTMVNQKSVLESSSNTSGGTQMYMAPELLTGALPSPRTDIYSLGVILYQMVIGDLRRPLGVGWSRTIKDRFLRMEVARCVVSEPDRRLQSACAVSERIESFERRKLIRRVLEGIGGVGAVGAVILAFMVYGDLSTRQVKQEAERIVTQAQEQIVEQENLTLKATKYAEMAKLILELKQNEIALANKIGSRFREPLWLRSDIRKPGLSKGERENIERLWDEEKTLEEDRRKIEQALKSDTDFTAFEPLLGKRPSNLAMFETNIRMRGNLDDHEWIILALDYEKIAQAYPQAVEPLIGEGVALFRAGDLQGAEAALNKAFKKLEEQGDQESGRFNNVLLMLSQLYGLLPAAEDLNDRQQRNIIRHQAMERLLFAMGFDAARLSLSMVPPNQRVVDESPLMQEESVALTGNVIDALISLLKEQSSLLSQDRLIAGLENIRGYLVNWREEANFAEFVKNIPNLTRTDNPFVAYAKLNFDPDLIARQLILARTSKASHVAVLGDGERAKAMMREIKQDAIELIRKQSGETNSSEIRNDPLLWRLELADADIYDALQEYPKAADILESAYRKAVKYHSEGLTTQDYFEVALRRFTTSIVRAFLAGWEGDRQEFIDDVEKYLNDLDEDSDQLVALYYCARSVHHYELRNWSQAKLYLESAIAKYRESADLGLGIRPESETTIWLRVTLWIYAQDVVDPDRLAEVWELSTKLVNAYNALGLARTQDMAFVEYTQSIIAAKMGRGDEAMRSIEGAFNTINSVLLPAKPNAKRIGLLYLGRMRMELRPESEIEAATIEYQRLLRRSVEEREDDRFSTLDRIQSNLDLEDGSGFKPGDDAETTSTQSGSTSKGPPSPATPIKAGDKPTS
jgi:serine/threonine protein kinase/class 3 adenylate cyclase